jgi:hypothetical protein
MGLAVAAMRLQPGVILDGEAVVYVADAESSAHITFPAALSRPRPLCQPWVRRPASTG